MSNKFKLFDISELASNFGFKRKKLSEAMKKSHRTHDLVQSLLYAFAALTALHHSTTNASVMENIRGLFTNSKEKNNPDNKKEVSLGNKKEVTIGNGSDKAHDDVARLRKKEVNINVLKNDETSHKVEIEKNPNYGKVKVNDDGTITYYDYDPKLNPDAKNYDVFQYEMTTVDGETHIAEVKVKLPGQPAAKPAAASHAPAQPEWIEPVEAIAAEEGSGGGGALLGLLALLAIGGGVAAAASSGGGGTAELPAEPPEDPDVDDPIINIDLSGGVSGQSFVVEDTALPVVLSVEAQGAGTTLTTLLLTNLPDNDAGWTLDFAALSSNPDVASFVYDSVADSLEITFIPDLIMSDLQFEITPPANTDVDHVDVDAVLTVMNQFGNVGSAITTFEIVVDAVADAISFDNSNVEVISGFENDAGASNAVVHASVELSGDDTDGSESADLHMTIPTDVTVVSVGTSVGNLISITDTVALEAAGLAVEILGDQLNIVKITPNMILDVFIKLSAPENFDGVGIEFFGTSTETNLSGTEVNFDNNTFITGPATLNIPGVNLSPVANNDDADVDEAGMVLINVAGNDTDPNSNLDVSTVMVIDEPDHGSYIVNADGTVKYTHDGSETLTDSFTYTIKDDKGLVSNEATVNINVAPVNDPPTANNDWDQVNEGGMVTIDVADNDNDPENQLDLASIMLVDGPDHGTLKINNDGTVKYTHDGSETTTDWFKYTIKDAQGLVSNVASVDLQINPVNDPPVAVKDKARVEEKERVIIDLLNNDFDVDGTLDLGSIMIISGPKHGSLELLDNGLVKYCNHDKYAKYDSFVYTVKDNDGAESNQATVKIKIFDGGSGGGTDGGTHGGSDAYGHGYSDGFSDGYSDGYHAVNNDTDGGSDGQHTTYSDGHSDGHSDGFSDGYRDAHSDGGTGGGTDKDCDEPADYFSVSSNSNNEYFNADNFHSTYFYDDVFNEGHDTIVNFDNVAKDGHDFVDLSDLFDNLGVSHYDRADAISLTELANGNFVLQVLDGANQPYQDFSITFVDPTNESVNYFTIGTHPDNDILI